MKLPSFSWEMVAVTYHEAHSRQFNFYGKEVKAKKHYNTKEKMTINKF